MFFVGDRNTMLEQLEHICFPKGIDGCYYVPNDITQWDIVPRWMLNSLFSDGSELLLELLLSLGCKIQDKRYMELPTNFSDFL